LGLFKVARTWNRTAIYRTTMTDRWAAHLAVPLNLPTSARWSAVRESKLRAAVATMMRRDEICTLPLR
jgi:hypothetical protein